MAKSRPVVQIRSRQRQWGIEKRLIKQGYWIVSYRQVGEMPKMDLDVILDISESGKT
jgi:hypothetical protein